MKLVTFLAILTALTNTILVHSYTPDGVNLNMVPLIHTDINDRAAYKLTSDNAETPQTRNVITSNSVQTPDVLKFNSETSDENNFQDDYLAPVTTDFDANMNENVLELLNQLQQDIRDEEDIAVKSALLLKLLQEMPEQDILPVIYVEGDDVEPDDEYETQYLKKRSGRYYRRYPWKRQHSRSRSKYDPESRYLCVPSRKDIYKLFASIHDNRKGNTGKTINFCNRKRQVKQIFTHIRFLG